MNEVHIKMLSFFCRYSDGINTPVNHNKKTLVDYLGISEKDLRIEITTLKALGYITGSQVKDESISILISEAGIKYEEDRLTK